MRRPLLAVLVLAAALVLGACGNKQDRVTHGETEASYLDLGELKYQVQISRQLNPTDREDRAYVIGLPNGEPELKGDETWFGVFIRVENEADDAQTPAADFELRDTRDQVYRPLRLGDDNLFAYRPVELGKDGVIPEPDTIPADSTIQGALLLFRLPVATLQNRPLELEIHNPDDAEDTVVVDLDV